MTGCYLVPQCRRRTVDGTEGAPAPGVCQQVGEPTHVREIEREREKEEEEGKKDDLEEEEDKEEEKKREQKEDEVAPGLQIMETREEDVSSSQGRLQQLILLDCLKNCV